MKGSDLILKESRLHSVFCYFEIIIQGRWPYFVCWYETRCSFIYHFKVTSIIIYVCNRWTEWITSKQVGTELWPSECQKLLTDTMPSNVCKHCGCTEIDEDATRGDKVCTSCGSVLEEQLIVSEIQFQENAAGGASVMGQFVPVEGTGYVYYSEWMHVDRRERERERETQRERERERQTKWHFCKGIPFYCHRHRLLCLGE